MKAVRLTIQGKVHNVGFRAFVKSNARKRQIAGTVGNLPEGTVEVYALGDDQAIDELVGLCRKGPFLAQVDDMLVEELDQDMQEAIAVYKEFEILQ